MAGGRKSWCRWTFPRAPNTRCNTRAAEAPRTEVDTTGANTDEPIVNFGKPYQEIVQAAKDRGADLILIATHSYTGLKYMQLGSTTERVVRYAPCPVLVVRQAEPQFSPAGAAHREPQKSKTAGKAGGLKS